MKQVIILAMVVAYTAAAAMVPGERTQVQVRGETVRERRDAAAAAVCARHTPCGWAVYAPFTRTVDYFLPNTCKCGPGTTCQRTTDNISISAYEYHCTH